MTTGDHRANRRDIPPDRRDLARHVLLEPSRRWFRPSGSARWPTDRASLSPPRSRLGAVTRPASPPPPFHTGWVHDGAAAEAVRMLKYGRSTAVVGPCRCPGVSSTARRSRHLVSGLPVPPTSEVFDQSNCSRRPSPTASVRRRDRPDPHRPHATDHRRRDGRLAVHRYSCGISPIGAVGAADRRCHHHGPRFGSRRLLRSGAGCSRVGRHALGGVRRRHVNAGYGRLHGRSTEVSYVPSAHGT